MNKRNQTGTFAFCIFLAAVSILFGCKKVSDCDDHLPVGIDTCVAFGTPYIYEKPFRFPQYELPADNPATIEGVQLGRILFYDENLSASGALSCASCHLQEFSFADPRRFSINDFGALTKRNAPALINQLWLTHTFWDGRVATLEQQAADALLNEQNIDYTHAINYIKTDSEMVYLFDAAFGCHSINEENIAKAIAQFVRSIISSNSRFDRFLKGEVTFTTEELNGFNILTTENGNCFHCHFGSPLLTSNNYQFDPYTGYHNNGLDSVNDVHDFADYGLGGHTGDLNHFGVFKAPTLRNLVFTGPFMHDGRFASIDHVINFYSDSVKNSPSVDIFIKQFPHGVHLTDTEKSELTAFLLTFTDSSVITNPNFSNPRP